MLKIKYQRRFSFLSSLPIEYFSRYVLQLLRQEERIFIKYEYVKHASNIQYSTKLRKYEGVFYYSIFELTGKVYFLYRSGNHYLMYDINYYSNDEIEVYLYKKYRNGRLHLLRHTRFSKEEAEEGMIQMKFNSSFHDMYSIT